MNSSLVNYMIKHYYERKQRKNGALLSGIIRLNPYDHEVLTIYKCCPSTLLEMVVLRVVHNEQHHEYRLEQIK
jgi:hypothetical protein